MWKVLECDKLDKTRKQHQPTHAHELNLQIQTIPDVYFLFWEGEKLKEEPRY